MSTNDTILLCPKNDEESLQILHIAESMNIPTLVSDQPHGARLEREKQLVKRLKKISSARRVAIVEIPGVAAEQELRDAGYEVVIIDHHRYDEIDRANPKSSLEQFLLVFGINDAKLGELGFNPQLVAGVAAIDRGFLWELRRLDLTKERRQEIREYYKALTMQLGPQRRAREEEVAKEAWEQRREQEGLIVVESEVSDVSFRDALSYLVAETFDEPRPVLIRQGTRRIYVQDTDRARSLHDRFGGFLFGGEQCWGLLADESRALPSVDEVITTVLK